MANRSRVLVTGGAGFIGRRLVRALLAEGHEVTVADLRAFPDPGVRTFVGDLCDPEAAARAVQPGTDVIMHLAAVTSVLASVQDPVSTHLLNVDATARLLELGRENEVGTFLLASTNAVVGNVGSAVINEQVVLRPLGHGERDGDDRPAGHRRAHPGRDRAGSPGRDAGRGARHLRRPGHRLPARAHPGNRHGHGLAGFRSQEGGGGMIYKDPQDQVVDDEAIKVFIDAYGERATSLPPVAIVIAAYNEAGAIGPVIEALPAQVRGLATAAIVVADGCADGTAAEVVTGSRRLGSQETKDMIRRTGVRFFAGTISMLTGQKISDTTFGLRAMRAEVTGAVQLSQPQYQASELLIGVITHGYKVAEVPATIHRRRVGESKKGQNPLYRLHLPGVNNLFYGLRFARVAYGTWWRERERIRRERRSAGRSGGQPTSGSSSSPVAQANGSGPGSVETSASS